MKKKITIALLIVAIFSVGVFAGQFQLNQKHHFIQRLQALANQTIAVNTEWNALYTEYVENNYSVVLTQEDIDGMGTSMAGLEVASVSTFLANKTQWDAFFITGDIVVNAEKMR